MSDLHYFQGNLFSSLQLPVLNDGKDDITPRYRDIHFLITQKSLEALDPSTLSQFLEPLSHPSSSDDLGLSDDELATIVQSRYIQQPSDVQNFANYLKEAADSITSHIKDVTERQQRWNEFKSSLSKKDDNTSSISPTSASGNTTVSNS